MPEYSTLTAVSSVDGRYAGKTESLRPVFSEYGLIHRRLMVEIGWFKAMAAEPAIKNIPAFSIEDETWLDELVTNFSVAQAGRVKAIEATTNHDVKAVEYFIKECFSGRDSLSPYSEFLHFGCTSEDINNLAYALMIMDARNQVVLPAMKGVADRLTAMAGDYATTPMLSRTHGQTASPTTMGKELANVAYRLERQQRQFEAAAVLGKCNGAVGNFNAHLVAYPDVDWAAFSRRFVESLNKSDSRFSQFPPC